MKPWRSPKKEKILWKLQIKDKQTNRSWVPSAAEECSTCSRVLEPQLRGLGLGQRAASGPENQELVQPSRYPVGRGAWRPGSSGNTAARGVGGGGLT